MIRALVPALIRVERHPNGPRLYLCGRRRHHGELGIVLFAAGLILVWHDFPDLGYWFR